MEGNCLTLEEQISDLGLAGDLADALRGAVKARSVETNREAGYIGVRPNERHIAAYFNKAFVDIAVEPVTSQTIASQHPGTRVIPKTTATHFVRCPAGTVDKEKVVDLVVDALDWRERGSHWSGSSAAGDAADLAGQTCQTCYLEIAKNGSCGCD